jgi:HIP---CoA ligase
MNDWYGSLDHTMPELIAKAGRDYGADPFIVGEDGAVTSFSALAGDVDRVATDLLSRGIAHGDRVAIWAPNSAGWIVAACAIESIGAIMVPINTRFRGEEAGYVLQRAGVKWLFAVPEFLGTDYIAMLKEAMGGAGTDRPIAGLPSLRGIAILPPQGCDPDPAALAAARAKVTPADTCDILFTSGTTGQPKGAMHSHGQALWVPGIWNRANDLRRGDRALIVNPFFHSFGYRAGWVSALVAGMTVYPVSSFDPAAALATIERERISVVMGPPTLFTALLDHPDRRSFDLSSLRVAHTGSSNIPVALIERIRDELAFDLVLTSYGLTEATSLVSVNYPTDSPEAIARTVGHALPGTELRIVNAQGVPQPHEAQGELLVRGPNVMQGYFDDPEATAAAIDAEGWLHTGDIASLDAEGILRIHDRLKDVVIVGGFNAYPAEIEHILLRHPAIAEVAVIAVPDERMGEAPGVCVVPRVGASIELGELIEWSRARMANYKVPRHLFVLDAFPRTPLGKVQKHLLRAAVLADAALRKQS